MHYSVYTTKNLSLLKKIFFFETAFFCITFNSSILSLIIYLAIPLIRHLSDFHYYTIKMSPCNLDFALKLQLWCSSLLRTSCCQGFHIILIPLLIVEASPFPFWSWHHPSSSFLFCFIQLDTDSHNHPIQKPLMAPHRQLPGQKPHSLVWLSSPQLPGPRLPKSSFT